jgi:hypothetical protein
MMTSRAQFSAVSSQLPITRNLSQAYILTLITGLLMAGASLAGLLFTDSIYPVEELRTSYVSNDVVNILIGLPILLSSLWLTRRGRLVGLLLWPGSLLYVLYNYIAYLFGSPFGFYALVYIVLILLIAYICYDLLRSIDAKEVQDQLSGAVPVRMAGWVLIGFGVLFIIRAIGLLAQTTAPGSTLPASEVGTLIADLVLSVVWIAGGVLLLRRLPLGTVSALGLLFAGSMLFVGLIAYLLLQPVLTGVPFSPVDILVVFVMGLVCFIPFILFLRGTLSVRTSS